MSTTRWMLVEKLGSSRLIWSGAYVSHRWRSSATMRCGASGFHFLVLVVGSEQKAQA